MGTPQVTPISETRHTGGYVVWDPSDGMITRESMGSGIMTAGLVLGALLTGATGVATALGTNAGNGTFGAIVAGNATKIGAYTVEFDDATHFVVSDPTGAEIGHGTTGQAFAAGGLGFTITAGGTAFVPGDSFSIAVTGTTKYVPFDPTATDGRQNAVAILWSGYRDTTAADRKAIVNLRGPMRVNASELVWGANVTTQLQMTAALAQLAKLGILNT
jgi:hypothetical protein